MKKRDHYFDNAKFILIFLVVFGHFIRPFIDDSAFIDSLYKLIYTFHMPAFILISGYFAKGFKEKGYILKITKKILLPYVIFQSLYSVYYFFLYSEKELDMSFVTFFEPEWSLWFLLSLFFWNILLHGFTKLKYSVAIALVLGVLVGYIEQAGGFLSLSRTFVFFPLFLIGYYLNREHFSVLLTPVKRLTSMLVLTSLFVSFYLFVPDFDIQWLFGSKPYTDLGATGLEGAGIRVLFYGVSFVTVVSFFGLVPTGKFNFTKWGRRTFYVYLAHGFFIKYFRVSPLADFIRETENYLLVALLTVIVTLLLSSKPVITFLKPLIEFKMPFTKKEAQMN